MVKHTYKILTVLYYHVTYEFQSESTLYSLPECQGTPCSKEAPYPSLSDSSVIRTHNHLVRKRTLDHLDHLFFGKFASIQCLSLLDYYFPYYLYCTSVHQRKTNTAQKMKFSIKDFFSKCDLETADLATFTEEIYNEKLHFLCSVHFKDPLKSGPHLKTEL